MAVNKVVAALANFAAQNVQTGQKALAEHPRRDAERLGALCKRPVPKAHKLDVDHLIQIAQQRIDVRFGAAAVAAADEMDYFHICLQSTCVSRGNTI